MVVLLVQKKLLKHWLQGISRRSSGSGNSTSSRICRSANCTCGRTSCCSTSPRVCHLAPTAPYWRTSCGSSSPRGSAANCTFWRASRSSGSENYRSGSSNEWTCFSNKLTTSLPTTYSSSLSTSSLPGQPGQPYPGHDQAGSWQHWWLLRWFLSALKRPTAVENQKLLTEFYSMS